MMLDQNDTSQPPKHDHKLLFQSVENKYLESDPNQLLQGVFICSYVKQEKKRVLEAFNKVNPKKVHFVIFGDESDEAFILARRVEDKLFLSGVFAIRDSERFVFVLPFLFSIRAVLKNFVTCMRSLFYTNI